MREVAANEYLERSGISSHVEEPKSFGPNLATLSMLSPVEMTLTPLEEELHGRDGLDHGNWVKILLEPRSLLLFQGRLDLTDLQKHRETKRMHGKDGIKNRVTFLGAGVS